MATETKVKWTPGPWKLELFGTASENIFGANGKHIVNISTTRCSGNATTVYSPEAEANARLISKAPEMHALLWELGSGRWVTSKRLREQIDALLTETDRSSDSEGGEESI